MIYNNITMALKMGHKHNLTLDDVLLFIPYYTDDTIEIDDEKNEGKNKFILTRYGFKYIGDVDIKHALIISAIIQKHSKDDRLNISLYFEKLKNFDKTSKDIALDIMSIKSDEYLYMLDELNHERLFIESDENDDVVMRFERRDKNNARYRLTGKKISHINRRCSDRKDGDKKELLERQIYDCDHAHSTEASDLLNEISGSILESFVDIFKKIKSKIIKADRK